MIFGAFIDITKLFGGIGAAAGAAGSVAGAIVQQRAARQAMAAMGRDFPDLRVAVPRDGLPPRDLVFLRDYGRWFRITDGAPHIPRVKRT